MLAHQIPKAWLRYARFEEKIGEIAKAREVYEKSLEYLGDDADETIYIGFAQFEVRAKEYDRARTIYTYALDNIPKKHAKHLYEQFIKFGAL